MTKYYLNDEDETKIIDKHRIIKILRNINGLPSNKVLKMFNLTKNKFKFVPP